MNRLKRTGSSDFSTNQPTNYDKWILRLSRFGLFTRKAWPAIELSSLLQAIIYPFYGFSYHDYRVHRRESEIASFHCKFEYTKKNVMESIILRFEAINQYSPYQVRMIRPLLRLLISATFMLCSCTGLFAQQTDQMVRLAKVKIDPPQITAYNKALLAQMKTAIALEPGVLTYYAVADKKDPSSITILEIYADTAAYNKHILTPHFRKYKDTVKDMVKSLELVDVDMIGFAKKPGS